MNKYSTKILITIGAVIAGVLAFFFMKMMSCLCASIIDGIPMTCSIILSCIAMLLTIGLRIIVKSNYYSNILLATTAVVCVATMAAVYDGYRGGINYNGGELVVTQESCGNGQYVRVYNRFGIKVFDGKRYETEYGYYYEEL